MGQLKGEWIRIFGRRRREIAPDEHQTEKIHKSGRREVFGYSAAGKLASFSTGQVNKAQLKELERYLYAPGGERVLVETVPGKKLTHALWDGHRPIEEFHEIGHGRGKKEKGELFTRDLGGQLLETAKFERRLGQTAHRRPDDDDDDRDEDDDREERGPHHRGRKLGHVSFIAGDFLGSTALVTNHRGRVLDRLQAGPFGELLEGNFARVKFGFTGHRLEERTGHWSALHRQLDPRAGRWTQRDPAGDDGSSGLFGYAGNRPATATDPFGLFVVLSPAYRGFISTLRRDSWVYRELDDDCGIVVGVGVSASGGKYFGSLARANVQLVASESEMKKVWTNFAKPQDPSSGLLPILPGLPFLPTTGFVPIGGVTDNPGSPSLSKPFVVNSAVYAGTISAFLRLPRDIQNQVINRQTIPAQRSVYLKLRDLGPNYKTHATLSVIVHELRHAKQYYDQAPASEEEAYAEQLRYLSFQSGRRPGN